MKFRDFLNEDRKVHGSPVRPLKGRVKGNTIEKNVKSANDFFGGDMGAVLFETDDKDTILMVYTAESPKYQYDIVKKESMPSLYHDQTGRHIAYVKPVGYVEFDNEGVITNISGAKSSDKIHAAYTYK